MKRTKFFNSGVMSCLSETLAGTIYKSIFIVNIIYYQVANLINYLFLLYLVIIDVHDMNGHFDDLDKCHGLFNQCDYIDHRTA